MDSDGYPEEDELQAVREWPYSDLPGMMDYVRERWRYADDGYWRVFHGTDELSKQPLTVYTIRTGGWSGNESLVGAMQENSMFMAICWEQSCRGGQYEFRIPDNLKEDNG